jgi:hypothetical protein
MIRSHLEGEKGWTNPGHLRGLKEMRERGEGRDQGECKKREKRGACL